MRNLQQQVKVTLRSCRTTRTKLREEKSQISSRHTDTKAEGAAFKN